MNLLNPSYPGVLQINAQLLFGFSFTLLFRFTPIPNQLYLLMTHIAVCSWRMFALLTPVLGWQKVIWWVLAVIGVGNLYSSFYHIIVLYAKFPSLFPLDCISSIDPLNLILHGLISPVISLLLFAMECELQLQSQTGTKSNCIGIPLPVGHVIIQIMLLIIDARLSCFLLLCYVYFCYMILCVELKWSCTSGWVW